MAAVTETEMDDARLARRLVDDARTAAFSTLALRPPGHPFGSLVTIATDDRGRPVLLLSELAEHTKNLQSSPLASLLVADFAAADPLAAPRVTLLGTCRRVAEADVADVRARYLKRHPKATAWVSLRDFAFYRLEPGEVRLVAGFGRMSWVDVEVYVAAT